VKAVILGAGGMLGRALARELPSAQALRRAECDITDVTAVRAALVPGVTHVLNAAAFTAVDAAETDLTHVKVNQDAVGVVAARCREIGAAFVHVSTDYVFNGRGIRPYREDDAVDPVNAYGRGKLGGERRAFDYGAQVLVVRSSWLFGEGAPNFVDTILRKAEAGEKELRVVDDQVGRPTGAADLARAIRILVERRAVGLVHFANAGETTWYELASEAVQLAGFKDVVMRPVSSKEFVRPARRPANSVLDTTVYERLVGDKPRPWRESLAEYVAARAAARPVSA
jgi:dTDP-4-dehydrorhamnose reductase